MNSSTNETAISTVLGDGYDECSYSYDSVFSLVDANITAELQTQWPCELRQHWNSILPLINLVQHLLHYGTAITVAAGLLLNALSYVVLSSPQMKRQSTNMYLAALAIYDACVLVFNFMIGVLRGQNQDPINASFQDNEWLCLVHSVLVELFNLLSVWMIVCFTIERCIAVFLPLKAATLITAKKTKLAILSVTAVLTIFSLHKLFVSGFEGDSVFGYKACLTSRKKYPEAIFFYVAFNTALPTLVIISANIAIILKVNQSSLRRKKLTGTNNSTITPPINRSDSTVTKTLLVVSSTYILLVLPLGITQMIELYWNNARKQAPSTDPTEQQLYIHYMKTKHLLKWIRALFFFFYQLNFAINFFLYILSASKFRKVLSTMLHCSKAKPDGRNFSKYQSGGQSVRALNRSVVYMSDTVKDAENQDSVHKTESKQDSVHKTENKQDSVHKTENKQDSVHKMENKQDSVHKMEIQLDVIKE